jgi:hypothetical protein
MSETGLDKLDKNEHAEVIKERQRRLVPLNIIFGAICGGTWFATLNITIVSPCDYGGYWCIWGIHGLILVLLFSISKGVVDGMVAGCKLCNWLLIFGPILIGIVAFLGLLVGVIPIGWSIGFGAGLGALLSSVTRADQSLSGGAGNEREKTEREKKFQ